MDSLSRNGLSLGICVEFGTEVRSIEDDPAGLRVTLDTDGRTEVVTAAYVLGAGGGHSVTRHSMHEHLAGATYGGRYVVADVKLRLPCPPECGRVIVGPTGFGLFSPLPGASFLERFGDSLAILAIVIVNAVLGLAQQRRAERALLALRQMAAPTARVVRSGKMRDVRSECLEFAVKTR